MSSVRRTLAGALLGGLVLLLHAVPAHAGSAQLKCVVNGSVVDEQPVPLIGGQTNYQFESVAASCVGVEDLSKPVLVVFDVSSTGVYKNVVCGTGKATSTSITVNPVQVLGPVGSKVDYEQLFESLEYQIDLVASKGVLYWHDDYGKAPAPFDPIFDDKSQENSNHITIGGWVSVEPKGPPGGQDCTDEKTITIFFGIEIRF